MLDAVPVFRKLSILKTVHVKNDIFDLAGLKHSMIVTDNNIAVLP